MREGERGAAVVELALVAPVLFLLLAGIMEMAWSFSQYLDVKHVAREGARLAAVNYQPSDDIGSLQTSDIVEEICRRMEDSEGARVQISFETSNHTAGSTAVVRVERDVDQLTGVFSFLDDNQSSSRVVFQLERDASFVATSGEQNCPAFP